MVALVTARRREVPLDSKRCGVYVYERRSPEFDLVYPKEDCTTSVNTHPLYIHMLKFHEACSPRHAPRHVTNAASRAGETICRAEHDLFSVNDSRDISHHVALLHV